MKTTIKVLLGLIVIVLISVALSHPIWLGIFPFGPEGTQRVTIINKYVDVGQSKSHYMVATDVGVFEVDNSVILGIWNADEIYGRLVVNQSYTIKTKGNKILFAFLFQEYPHIIGVSSQ